MSYLTIKLRVKDKHSSLLIRMAKDVNFVFNYLNETSERAIRERRQWLSGFDFNKLTAGFSRCDGVVIGSGTVNQICLEYAARRNQCKKHRLQWRVSDIRSPKYSLGWVPFRDEGVKYVGGQIRFAGHFFSLWDSYDLSKYELRSGSFTQDARGRWYFNAVVKAQIKPSIAKSAVGIDLGLKTAITT